MRGFKPIERSFYSPILEFLKDIGFQGVNEIGILTNRDYMDILFTYLDRAYIAEIKVSGNPEEMVRGIVQVDDYARKYGTNNKIVICYHDDVRNPVQSIGEFNRKAIDRSCRIVSLTDEWHEYIQDMPLKTYFSTLKDHVDQKYSSIQRLDTASIVLHDCIKLLSNLINTEFRDNDFFEEILNYLTKDQGLFLSLCNQEKNSRLRNQVIDLLAYILANQIIFYFLYSKNITSSEQRIDELKELTNVRELDKYFEQIKLIDFKPIYDIDVLSRIPSNPKILNSVNDLIKCLSPLKVDELKYDLFGRLIGKSMPDETRDILASYYTKTNSAEFLSKLLIQDWREKVWDLACGSGTLLVSSYNRKMELYEQKKGRISEGDAEKLHITFIQDHITGTDIMPFACHLTGLNLSAQNLRTKTDFMRICNKNSLEIDLDREPEVKEAYGDVSNSLEKLTRKQKELSDFYNKPTKSLTCNNSKVFKLEKVDTIIINPPFTQYNKIPAKYRDEFFRPDFTKLAGKKVGLWSVFLVAADKFLNNGGKIGAIIHTSFLRGKQSQQIRDYFLDNYTIEYIIKPSYDSAFSEDTSITDIIIIAKKRLPDENHETNIILLKNSIDRYTTSDIEACLIRPIDSVIGKIEENDYFTSIKVKQTELQKNRGNLVIFMFGKNMRNMNKINEIYKEIKDCKISKPIGIENNQVQAGIQFRPAGESKKRVIGRKHTSSRIKRVDLYFDKDVSDNILEYFDKEGNIYKIKENELQKTIRTLVGINKLDASDLFDYLIPDKRDTKKSSKVVFAHKMRLNSKDSFLMSVYFNEKIIPTNSLSMYLTDEDIEAKLLVLYFSSVLYLIQFIKLDKKTTKGYLEIGEEDMKKIYIPDIEKISEKQKNEILTYFENNRDKTFPCIKTQLEDRLPERIELDKFIFKILGLKVSRKELDEIYDVILDEI